jgi:hypothetical protein
VEDAPEFCIPARDAVLITKIMIVTGLLSLGSRTLNASTTDTAALQKALSDCKSPPFHGVGIAQELS